MIPSFRKHYEKVLLGLGAVALLGGAGWTWRQERGLAANRPELAPPVLRGGNYPASRSSPPREAGANWRPAPAQSAGGAWVYELFTPPVIHYDAAAGSFVVTPPEGFRRAAGEAFGLSLVAVRLEPYRLQLTGYFGSTDDFVAAFSIPGSSLEVVLARPGQRFEQLGLTLKSFEVRKVLVEHNDRWPVWDVAGFATLTDDWLGTEVVLDTRARKLTSAPMAVMQRPGSGGVLERGAGDSWREGEVTYRIERIQLEPAEVVVARIAPDGAQAEIHVLHLPTAGDGQNQSTSHPRNVAINGP